MSLSNDARRSRFPEIFEAGGIPPYILYKDQIATLEHENLHPEVYKHAKDPFQHEKYAHCIWKHAKRTIKQSGKSSYLRATTGSSDSDENFHDGLKLLAEGVMAGVRNISAHEPILSWPINKEDRIDALHFSGQSSWKSVLLFPASAFFCQH